MSDCSRIQSHFRVGRQSQGGIKGVRLVYFCAHAVKYLILTIMTRPSQVRTCFLYLVLVSPLALYQDIDNVRL